MDELRLNKYLAGILCGGLLLMATIKTTELLYPHQAPGTDAYPVAATEDTGAGSAAGAGDKPAGPEPILALLAGADLAAGEKLAKKCAACHTFDEGGANKVGPNLWGVVGNKQRHLDDFSYSAAFTELGGSWSYTELNGFLRKPREWVPGTKMSYAGLRKAEDRANIIAWMRSMAATPLPLPTAAEIEAETSAEASQ